GALINTGGVISGDILLMGTYDKLSLNSNNTRIHNFSFTPAYTNVPYVVSGDVKFDRSGIYFDSLKVHDKFNNEGTLSGSLRHNYFRNMYLDASLAFNNLQCLNTTESDNQTFYGNAFVSGNINLTGPFNNLFADVTATTNARSAIHIPLSSAASAKNEELLTFTSSKVVKIDPYLERMKRIQKRESAAQESSKANFALKARANVTSEAELFIEINKQLGDILRCRGNGTVDINLDPSKSILDLKGDYTIEEGGYKFVLLGITAKDFILDNGGSINFNGDIKNTTLNVGATYHTKASVSTLIADTSAVGNRRTVDCGIKLSGSLSNPNIGFTVDVKDLDPITKGRVESALSTDDKVQKQFMALILSGSFIPDEQSGIFNNSTILYSNAGEMLSNQVNNVFRQLDIPLDLGFNYQPASDGKTRDMFDVALSYQAFNNRVVINGNVGNNQVSQTWGGAFEAEVKLDKRGKVRLKAFTRSPDDYSNYLDNTQRHGIGFTYQDEFDTFRELLRNIFWSKKRKEAYERQMIMEAEKAISQEQEKGGQ
ncbi:MAG: translocation/assembly module TamB domain-containing protein, partial [Bacteroidales bacterium]|nr:translocation/assembly module TamB domain-containing protein [Bacteroidales bacterium]